MPDNPAGFVFNSTANGWEAWVRRQLPECLAVHVRRNLLSNIKHIIAGLEMKAALISPHAKMEKGKPVLFESYFQILTLKFSIGVFSVCEGLGSANYLGEAEQDGMDGRSIQREHWQNAIVQRYGGFCTGDLGEQIGKVQRVRDLLHQDRLGMRANIDWHALGYAHAFLPACQVVQCLLSSNPESVPAETVLRDL